MTTGPDDATTITAGKEPDITADPPPATQGRAPADDRERRAARRGRLGSLLGLLALIVFSCVTVGVTVATHVKLSPIDEAAHIDSVFRAPSIVRTGELMLPQTLDEI